MHLAGLAVQSDEVKAIRLLRESANDGNQWAQYLLGKFCFRGEHTEKNLQEAERLLTASAMQKNSQTQYLLAKLYLCEDGIPKDAEKALHWLWESVKQKKSVCAIPARQKCCCSERKQIGMKKPALSF